MFGASARLRGIVEEKGFDLGKTKNIADGGLSAGEPKPDAAQQREFPGADHDADARAVNEADAGEINGERGRGWRGGGDVFLRETPDVVGVDGGDFALPDERAGGFGRTSGA